MRHSNVPYSPSPALKAKPAASCPWPWRVRTQPFSLTTTVTGSSITFTSATALPIGLGQTISKPSVVARMVELLMQGGLRGPDGKLGRVLDIGTGCGYQAVVLGQLASEVYSIERLRDLHEKARANLRPLRIANVHLILGDGMAGFAKGAPYAGIIAAAGGEAVPDAWIEQLAYGGRLVAPIATAAGQQALVVIDRSRQGIQQTILETVNFVPLKSGVA